MTDDGRAHQELPVAPRDFEVLLALSREAAHGYGIIKAVEEQSGGVVRMSTSTLYATLRRMERRGLVVDAGRMEGDASGGPARKYFRITPFGRRVAQLEGRRLRSVSRRAGEALPDLAEADGRGRGG